MMAQIFFLRKSQMDTILHLIFQVKIEMANIIGRMYVFHLNLKEVLREMY